MALPWSGPDEYDRLATRNIELQQEFKVILDGNGGRPIGVCTLHDLFHSSTERISCAFIIQGGSRPRLEAESGTAQRLGTWEIEQGGEVTWILW